MKNRAIILLITLALTLSLAACDRTEDGLPADDDEPVISFTPLDLNNSDNPGDSGDSGTPTDSENPAVKVIAEREDDYSKVYELIMTLQEQRHEQNQMANTRSGGIAPAVVAEAAVEEASFDDADGGGIVAGSAPMPESDEPLPPASAPDAPGGTDAESIYMAEEPVMGGGEAMGGGGEDNSGDDFSDTNNQVAGVQEGDIVKTDGKNIYVASQNWQINGVSVVSADNGNMHRIALLQKDDAHPRELLLYDDKLIVIWARYIYPDYDDNYGIHPGARLAYDSWWWWYEADTIVEVYDTNGSFNSPIASYTQDGDYVSSRMIDNNIYLITNYSPVMSFIPFVSPEEFRMEDLDLYIPSYVINGDEYFVPSNAIILPEKLNDTRYTVISGLDVNSRDLLVSTQANLSSAHVIYSSHNNIYTASTVYNFDEFYSYYTEITKFSFFQGFVSYAAAGRVDGYIENQFYMDEYKGILRVFAQTQTRSNWSWSWRWGVSWDETPSASLYTFDGNMNRLARITGIGLDEFIQSARFAGDIGYVVTFRLTDPLFSFDLSDPHNPIILDELKIPGFSRYLHIWGDGLLLGVGVEADEETGMRTGLKLSMFDTSDNEDLWERHVYVIDTYSIDGWSWSPAEHDHRAVLACPDKNIIAFPYSISTYSSLGYGESLIYGIFSYDEHFGFTLIGEIRDANYYDYYDFNRNRIYKDPFMRGLYIGDYIYAIASDRIVSARLGNFTIIQELMFLQ
jgi:uncharacterized secreted protein with C-terminal beta-propeller domain